MARVLRSRTLAVSIERPPRAVYEFVANPENLPRWAPGLCRAVRRTAGGWVVDTPAGPMGFRFVPRNDLGVLDHYVTPPGGPETLNPMRVVPNGEGSEVLFTLCAPPGVPDEAWAEDARLVARDLAALKALLEGTGPPGAAPDRTAAGPT